MREVDAGEIEIFALVSSRMVHFAADGDRFCSRTRHCENGWCRRGYRKTGDSTKRAQENLEAPVSVDREF